MGIKFYPERPIEGTETVVRVPNGTDSGTRANVSSNHNLNIGDKVTVSIVGGGRTTGTVTQDHGASGSFVSNVHDNTQPGNMRESNLGRGIFEVEVD